jgi:hypothetical protein
VISEVDRRPGQKPCAQGVFRKEAVPLFDGRGRLLPPFHEDVRLAERDMGGQEGLVDLQRLVGLSDGIFRSLRMRQVTGQYTPPMGV